MTHQQQAWLNSPDDTWRPRVSYFKPPISNVLPSEEISLQEVHRRIIGDDFAKITRELRAITDPKLKRRYKAANFPYVTFAGSFAKRQDAALLKSSLLMVFDFDQLEDLPQARRQLLDIPFFDTELLFTSPSGNGLKWVIKFYRDDISYQDYFLSLANYLIITYNLTPDFSGKDVSRACFLPHDPQAYLNPKHKTDLNELK